ncbi:MAG: hypothetical protein IKK92_01760 [Prevotella sp.]|nr:hypothetical protein [Prevotella sp.]
MDISGAFEVKGIVRQKQDLENLLMSNPAMEKKVQGLIRKVLLVARRQVSGDIKGVIKSDPRQAYKAVKSAVYKRILGGNISLLSKRTSGKRGPVPPVVHQLETRVNSKGNHRGGNRMPRSRRTEDLLTYQGADRGFILRFLNAGTDTRESGIGFRGAIAPRNFFADSSQQAMENAAAQLDTLLDELIKKELK